MPTCICIGTCLCVGAAIGYFLHEYYNPQIETTYEQTILNKVPINTFTAVKSVSISPNIEFHPLILPERVESIA
jgi:hypothetical protein